MAAMLLAMAGPANRLAAQALVAGPADGAATRPGAPAGGATAPAAEADGPTYADFADLADSAPLVAVVKVAGSIKLPPERAGNVRPGWTRYYVEGKVVGLLVGSRPIGESVSYLVDIAQDEKGRSRLPGGTVAFIFARPVADNPAQIQLIAPDAQFAATPQTEATLKQVLADLHAPGAPARITAVREALFVPGTLAGAGETQISLQTAGGGPASISITHLPGQPAVWAASFGEVFDTSGKPPARNTLAWYRLACFLPRQLPIAANVSQTAVLREQAAADYRLMLAGLGTCDRYRERN